MELARIYAHRFTSEDKEAMRAVWRVLVDAWFQRWIPSGAAVLDVGAGLCLFINQIEAARRVALDANPAVADHCDSGVQFVLGASLDALPPNERFDVIFLSNFLEHLPDAEAVLTFLAQARKRLTSTGRLMILQPNFALVGAKYFDFIDHKVILTDRSLIEALELSGYRIAYFKRRFLPYTSKSALPKAPWMVALYLRFPPAQFLLAGQSFVVAESVIPTE